jgi:hypothetical protein
MRSSDILPEEVYSTLGLIVFHRVRIAGRVLPGNLRKIHSQDLPSFLYASKGCSSRPSHLRFFPVLERWGRSSLEDPSSLLLESGSLLLNPLSSLLLDRWLPAMQEPWYERIGLAIDKDRDGAYRLRPVKRNECCCSGLVVKSSICPTWPMLSMSWLSWLKDTPCPSQPSWITSVKEQQYRECGRNVTSVRVGMTSQDDTLGLGQSYAKSALVVTDVEGNGEGS